MSIQTVLVLLLISVSAYTDLREGKIFNWATYPAAIAGIALSIRMGPPTLADSITGLLSLLLIFGLLHRFGGFGAGDAKLMAAIGSLKGLSFAIFCSFYTLGVASLCGLIVLAWTGRLIPVGKWMVGMLVSVIVPGYDRPRLEATTTMPFAPCIFVATAYCLYLEASHGRFALDFLI